uniref:Uncharacterized protein n=1 Tax=Panagrolaimus sp. PS1159 TaxID=55785 RepID=A0AC35GU28_9BILA
MKRRRSSVEEEARRSEKQSRKHKSTRLSTEKNLKKLSRRTSFAENVDLNGKISSQEPELPSLNDSLENNIASPSSVSENKIISSLHNENDKLKAEILYLKSVQKNYEKRKTPLLSKESQLLQLKNELNRIERKLKEKNEENEQLKKDLTDEKKQISDKQSMVDVNLENVLRQTISQKDKTLNGLHQKLEQAYKDLENQKDETREIEAGKIVLENRIIELQEAAKTTKEKEEALAQQIEELQQKLGEQKNETDQTNYEAQLDRDSYEIKLAQSRDALKEKNQEIAELRKKLDVQEVFYDEQVNVRIDVTESKAKTLEKQYIETRAELHELQQKYNDLQRIYDETIEDNRKMLEKKDNKIFALKKDYESINKKYSDAKREIGKLNNDKSNLRFEIKKKEDHNSHSQRHLENALQEVQKLKDDLDKANEELNYLKTNEEKSAKATTNVVQLLKDIEEIRQVVKEKDLKIADLQKQKDDSDILLSQTLNDYAYIEEKLKENHKLIAQKENENDEIIKEKDKAVLQYESIQAEKENLLAQMQELENVLNMTQQALQSINTEFADEKEEHEKAKNIVAKRKELIEKLTLLKNDETLRADEAVAKLAAYKVELFQNQSLLKSEQDQRILLQTQLLHLHQQIKEVENAKEAAVKEVEDQLSHSRSEMQNVEKKLKHLQKKYSEIQSQMENEKTKQKKLADENKRLAHSFAEAKTEIEKYKAEISSSQKMAKEKDAELQKLCNESNILFQKFMALCKK